MSTEEEINLKALTPLLSKFSPLKLATYNWKADGLIPSWYPIDAEVAGAA